MTAESVPAQLMGDYTVLRDKPVPPAPVRRCSCGTVLSRLNPGPLCFPCAERMNDYAAVFATAKKRKPSSTPLATHCIHGHLLDGVERSGRRYCSTCKRQRMRARRAGK